MMRRFLPSCFGGISKPEPQGVNRHMATQYETPIGRIIIVWDHLLMGLSLTIKIYLSESDNENLGPCIFNHRINPSDPGERYGTRKFQIKPSVSGDPCRLELAWDFSRAKYRMEGDAQPNSQYYFCIASEGEVIVLEGDLKDQAHTQFIKAPNRDENTNVYAPAFFREDTVDLKGRLYGTTVNLGGEEREVLVNVDPGNYAGMIVNMDGVNNDDGLEFKRLRSDEMGSRWFRSREESILVSWQQHGYNPSLSKKKNKIRFASERDATRVVLNFGCISRKGDQPTYSAYILNLIST